jgi:hypothetical protein
MNDSEQSLKPYIRLVGTIPEVSDSLKQQYSIFRSFH